MDKPTEKKRTLRERLAQRRNKSQKKDSLTRYLDTPTPHYKEIYTPDCDDYKNDSYSHKPSESHSHDHSSSHSDSYTHSSSHYGGGGGYSGGSGHSDSGGGYSDSGSSF